MFRVLGVRWTLEQLDRHYSPNWHRVYRAARVPRDRWAEADRQWALAYDHEHPPLMPGARPVLHALGKDFRLAIVTSGNRRRVRRQLREFELVSCFIACVCAEDTLRKKPHPAPLLLALRRLRVRPEESVYVGDTAEDIQMARRAGVHAVGVRGPFPTLKRLRAAKPDVVLDSIRELPPYVWSLANLEAARPSVERGRRFRR